MAPPNAPVVPSGTAPGVFVRGTLRMPREGLFDIVNANLKQNFGGLTRWVSDLDTEKLHLHISMYIGVYGVADVLRAKPSDINTSVCSKIVQATSTSYS
jgi:hypothetical protein